MASSPAEINALTKKYLLVFGALLVGTCLTVAMASVDWLDFGHHGFDTVDCIIGLAIATAKASLVGYIFMHLNHEKKGVYWIIISGIFGALSLACLTALAYMYPIFDPYFFR